MPVAPNPFPFSFGTPAQVLVPNSAMIDAPATRWQDDPEWAYSADNIADYPANGWFQGAGCAFPGCIALIDGFVLGSHNPANQKVTIVLSQADFPGLTPNRPVRVQGVMDWYRYTFAVNSEARVLVKANGASSYNIPENLLSGTVGGGPAPYHLTTTVDGSGNLTIEFGIFLDDGIGSTSIGAELLSLEVLSMDESWDIIPDSAVLYIDGVDVTSITRGGVTLDPRIVYENYEFEGKTAPVDGLDEVVSMSPVLNTRFMEVGERDFETYQPGGSWSDTIYDRTFTPPNMRSALASHLTDVRCVWRRWSGGYLQARFPKAFAASWNLGTQDKSEGEIPVQIEARQDLSGGANPKTTPLFYIDRLPSTWTV